MDTNSETVLTLSEAARKVPSLNGKRPHTSTIWRWCRKGIKGIRLEYVRVGSRICTSQEALGRFFNALAEADQPAGLSSGSPSPPLLKSADRKKCIENAKRKVASHGI